MNLAQLQQALQEHVLHADSGVVPEIAAGHVPVATRLGVYSDAYRLRLVGGLAANFPQMQRYMGDELFDAFARQYIDRSPSTHYSIRWFGNRWPEVLDETVGEQPWLGDLARWEWSLATAFDEADAEALTIDALANIEPDRWFQLRFKFHPSLQHVSLRTNAPAIFKALTDDTDVPDPVVLEKEQDWLIWREDLTPSFRSAPESEARALKTLRDGGSFEDMCETLCEWYEVDQVPAQAASLLKTWIVDGLVIHAE